MADPNQRALVPSDIIEIANRRTERRGKTLDLPAELVMAVQEVCQERRWHWRKKSIPFQTVADTAVYDLTQQDGMVGLTVERVCGGYVRERWQGPKIFDSPNAKSNVLPNPTAPYPLITAQNNPPGGGPGMIAGSTTYYTKYAWIDGVGGISAGCHAGANGVGGYGGALLVAINETPPSQAVGYNIYIAAQAYPGQPENGSETLQATVMGFDPFLVVGPITTNGPLAPTPIEIVPPPKVTHGDLTPIFETDRQELSRESTDTGPPGYYFMDGQDQFRVCPIPSGVYTIRVPAWVLPDDSPMQDTIPLVPAYLHQLLLKKLEAQIFRYTLGEGNSKYMAAQAEYAAALARACMSVQFAEGRVREWTDEEDAVQSG